MGLHKPFDRHMFTIAGLTMTQGGSLDLAKGQFGIFFRDRATKRGMMATDNFAGYPADTKYVMRLGISDLPVTRSVSNKAWSTFPFRLQDVLDIRVSAPERTEQSLDEVILGYNGIDANTNMVFEQGSTYKFNLELSGEAIGYLGYEGSVVNIPAYVEAEGCPPFMDCDGCIDCDPCAPVPCLPLVMDVIKQWRDYELRGGRKVSEVVEIMPVHECEDNLRPETIPYDFYCLDVCDTGDQIALAQVQAQYQGTPVTVKCRVGAITTYEILLPRTDGAPEAFTSTFASISKGCECPAGYDEVAGGFLYAVCLEDDGLDLSARVEGLPNAVAGTATKWGQTKGSGNYSVILTQELTDAEFEAFILANPTATLGLSGEVSAVCNKSGEETHEWENCGTCDAVEECYFITLPDTECGENRLAELQAAYPDLTIELATDENGEVISAACQGRYRTCTISNLVCEECDPIFEDFWVTEPPSNFEGIQWEFDEESRASGGTGCKCGIRVKGKELITCPTECLKDELGFMYTSTQVRISGGYTNEVREGETPIVQNPFKTTQLSSWKPITHLGANLWQYEDSARMYFGNEPRHTSYLERVLKGEQSHVEACGQYVDYVVRLRRKTFSQDFANQEEETINLHIIAQVGVHKDVETLLNKLAGAAGLPIVQAFG